MKGIRYRAEFKAEAHKQEVNQLNAALKPATEERVILKAAVYFASHQEVETRPRA